MHMTGNQNHNTAAYFPVTVIGGGMVGLSLAVALAQGGIPVAVVDKEPMSEQLMPEFDGRVSAISAASRRLLENIRVWNALHAHAEPILDIIVHDKKSPFFVHYDHQDVGTAPMGYIAENRHIRMALQQRAKMLPLLKIFSPVEWESVSYTSQHALVKLKNETQIKTNLVVAADGKNSRLRREAQIQTFAVDYKQTAIVATIKHELSHNGLAQEKFFPVGPFAVLPMKGSCSSLVWVESPSLIGQFLKMSKSELEKHILQRIGQQLGEIQLEGEIFTYPLHLVMAKKFYSRRLVLIGDAAHGMHPIAGQGMNLGYRDVAVLAELIQDAARLGQDLGSSLLLQRYQQLRRFDAAVMLGVTDGLTRLFSNSNPLLRFIRNAGLGVVQQLPGAKHFFMRHAMGDIGDMPRLMQRAIQSPS